MSGTPPYIPLVGPFDCSGLADEPDDFLQQYYDPDLIDSIEGSGPPTPHPQPVDTEWLDSLGRIKSREPAEVELGYVLIESSSTADGCSDGGRCLTRATWHPTSAAAWAWRAEHVPADALVHVMRCEPAGKEAS